MRYSIFSIFTLLFLVAIQAVGQSNMTVQLRAYNESEKRMRDVEYTIQRNKAEAITRSEKKGIFQFFVHPKDSIIVLTAKKEGYRSKVMIYPASTYNFNDKYSVQEIDLMFEKGDENNPEYGELLYERKKYVIKKLKKNPFEKEPVVKVEKEIPIDSSMLVVDTLAADSVVENPDFKMFTEQTEIAADTTLQEEFNFEESGLSEYFSVQIGAFSNKVNPQTFSMVPDFRMVQDVDFNRCFSGKFVTRQEAEKRLTEVIELGYLDAFLVKFKGNQRVSF